MFHHGTLHCDLSVRTRTAAELRADAAQHPYQGTHDLGKFQATFVPSRPLRRSSEAFVGAGVQA
jgi:hypothetical protein